MPFMTFPSRLDTHRPPSAAFTLVELLSVIAIVGILSAILVASIGHIRESVRDAGCSSNLRQIFTAARLWAQDNKGRMPDSRWWQEPASNPFTSTWSIAPYLDLGDGDQTATSTVYTCDAARSEAPSSRAFARTYSMNQYAGGSYNGIRQDLVRSGPAQLGVFMDGVQVTGSGEYFSYATEAHMASDASPGAQFPHGGRMNVVYADGHVAAVTEAHARRYLSENRIRVPFWGGDLPSNITD